MSRDTLIPVLQSDLDAMAAERDALRVMLQSVVQRLDIETDNEAWTLVQQIRALLAKGTK
jgi:hypothetical protein